MTAINQAIELLLLKFDQRDFSLNGGCEKFYQI